MNKYQVRKDVRAGMESAPSGNSVFEFVTGGRCGGLSFKYTERVPPSCGARDPEFASSSSLAG